MLVAQKGDEAAMQEREAEKKIVERIVVTEQTFQ